jgi:hypothetical protein
LRGGKGEDGGCEKEREECFEEGRHFWYAGDEMEDVRCVVGGFEWGVGRCLIMMLMAADDERRFEGDFDALIYVSMLLPFSEFVL